MCYSMFQKVIHRSELPKCADIIVLAEAGLSTLIFQKKKKSTKQTSKQKTRKENTGRSKQMAKFSIALSVLQRYLVLSQMLGS